MCIRDRAYPVLVPDDASDYPGVNGSGPGRPARVQTGRGKGKRSGKGSRNCNNKRKIVRRRFSGNFKSGIIIKDGVRKNDVLCGDEVESKTAVAAAV